MQPFGVMNHLPVRVFNNAQEAIDAGFDYKTHEPKPKPLEVETAVVVRNGTLAGNSTLDLVMINEDGDRYVLMLTGNLIKMLPL